MPSVTSTLIAASATPIVLQLASANWTLPDTHGFRPLAAANKYGVLWVKYPPADQVIGGEIGSPRPTDNYALMYTPMRSGGGDLTEGARVVMTVAASPDTTGETNPYLMGINYIGCIDAVADERFLLSTYESSPGAAHGAAYRWWWLEPRSGKSELLGGPAALYAAQFAQNGAWSFWSGEEYSEPAEIPFAGPTYLVNLYTGEKRTLTLPGPGVVCSLAWGKDGLLRLELCTTIADNTFWTLDPSSGTFATMTCDDIPDYQPKLVVLCDKASAQLTTTRGTPMPTDTSIPAAAK